MINKCNMSPLFHLNLKLALWGSATVWKFESLQKSNVEIPTCFSRKSGVWEVISHEGGALINEISPLIKEAPELLRSFLHVGIQGEAGRRSGPSPPCRHHALGQSVSGTVRNKALWLVSQLSMAFCCSTLNGLRQFSGMHADSLTL